MSNTLSVRTRDLGWGCTDILPEHIDQDQDTDAALFDAYLNADDQAAREAITDEMGRRGLLSGVRVA